GGGALPLLPYPRVEHRARGADPPARRHRSPAAERARTSDRLILLPSPSQGEGSTGGRSFDHTCNGPAARPPLSPALSRHDAGRGETSMRIALAGAGAFGEKHLDGLKNIDGVEIASVISRRAEQA